MPGTNPDIVSQHAQPDPLIEGAGGIALELFGENTPSTRRRVFYLLERGLIRGAFKLGAKHVARLSVLRAIGRPES